MSLAKEISDKIDNLYLEKNKLVYEIQLGSEALKKLKAEYLNNFGKKVKDNSMFFKNIQVSENPDLSPEEIKLITQ